jgi:hypothetical protein
MKTQNWDFLVRSGAVALALAAVMACGSSPQPESASGPPSANARSTEGAVGSTSAADTAGPTFCWIGSYGRGAGTVPTACPAGQENDAGLCYPVCQSGYYAVGPVCWQSCPDGYTDEGALCAINAQTISADNSGCPWYDECGLTFARGCSTCPEGYENNGCTCQINANVFAKSTYGRGAGAVPTECSGGGEYDAGLCYTSCGANYDGIGPVCWAGCPASMPVSCGVGCADTQADCGNALINQVTKIVQMAANIGALVVTAGTAAPETYVASVSLGATDYAASVAAIQSALLDAGKGLTEQAAEDLANQMVSAAQNGAPINWAAVDPTGVAAVVEAFDAPLCTSLPSN